MISQKSRLERYFLEYSQDHRTRGNRHTHVFGIPLIMMAVLGWLARLNVVKPEYWATAGLPLSLIRWDLGVAAILAALVYYFFLSWRLALPFAGVLYGLYWFGRALPNSLTWTFFIAGWILQLYGHQVYEKRSPAFMKNVEHLLIGPFWIFAKALGDPSSDPSSFFSSSDSGAKKES